MAKKKTSKIEVPAGQKNGDSDSHVDLQPPSSAVSDNSDFIKSLESRLLSHSNIINSLVDLIPTSHFIHKEFDDANFVPNKAPKQAVKDASKKAKKRKLDPESRKSIVAIQAETAQELEETPPTETQSLAKTHTELKSLMQAKIAEIKAKRMGNKAADPGSPTINKSDLLQQRKQTLAEIEDKKELRQKKKKERKNEAEIRKSKKKSSMEKPQEGDDDDKFSEDEIKQNISFGNIDFGITDSIKKKGATDIKSKLKMVENKSAKLIALKQTNPEKAVNVEEAEKWKSLLDRTSGITIKDDPKLLKKSIKREEKRKVRSTEKWKERRETVQKSQHERARKRETNLKERSESKKKGGHGKAKRPGFEGGIRKKTKK
ncbi:hypothetical protein HK096_008216 [Nowakowskiella sp. JEL0078]|nr:hypothetical protein HK096_008216 [Nowakowskiella sp. JEL0078]